MPLLHAAHAGDERLERSGHATGSSLPLALSAMAFSVGFTLGAVGPFGIGLLRDLTGGYEWAVGAVVVLCLAQLAMVPALRPPPRQLS